MADSVIDLAARCRVAIYGAGRFLGSGFLVAPGQVLTCAHVAAEGAPGPLTVRLADRELAACEVRLIPERAEPGRTYAPPDLAVITVDAEPDQPVAWLAESGPDAGSNVLCLGFSEVTTESEVAVDSVVLQVAAASGGGFIKVQQGEIPRGMSGSLVLDLGTHRVCGLVKTSRDTDAPRGGWIIPVPVIADHLGDLVGQNKACHDATSPWRQMATRHAEFSWSLFRSREPLRAASPPASAPPSWWLDPRHRATRFQDRPELEPLLAWARDEDPATPVVRLVTGEGGAGKTRLAIELATRLTAGGWIAGILTADHLERLPQIAEALHEILAYGHRVFIALDYPEGMSGELTKFLAQLPLPDEGIVRILLLARFGGDWWDTLHPAGEIKYLIDSTPVRLTPLSSGPGATASRFGEALQDYRARILGPAAADALADAGASLPPALATAAARHNTAIKLHALALVSALHERDHGALPDHEVAWADPLKSLVNHERRHWTEAARGRGLSCVRDQGWAGRILLVPTLLAVYRGEDGTAAISRIPGFAEQFPSEAAESAALLRDLYPPDASSSLRWWSPLPLDRLGETLLAAVLGSLTEDQAVEYVIALLHSAGLTEAVQGLIVMTRLSGDTETTSAVRAALSRCQDALAAADESRLLPALMVADRQVPPGVRPASERYLARLRPAAAMALVQSLNRKSIPRQLRETGLALLDRAERALDTDEERFRNVPDSVRDLTLRFRESGIDIPLESAGHVGVRALRAELLMHLGRAGEAVGPAESAARMMRAMYRVSGEQGSLYDGDHVVMNFGGSQPGNSRLLLMVLGVYAQVLHTVGRLAESAEVRRECVSVARHSAGQENTASESDLVIHLGDLAEALLELEQTEQAEPWAREAAERARALPDPGLQVVALTIWAKTLDRAGRTATAQEVADDAVRILQQDAGATIDRVLAARVTGALGHLAPPGATAPDLLTELRNAVTRDPATVLPQFVFAALERAEHLAEQGDLEGAARHMNEALAQARRLAADDPDTNALVLAHVLKCSAKGASSTDPAAEMDEAVRICRRMVDERGRDDLRADLALMLMEQALMLRDAGRDADCLPGFAEAIGLLRPLLAEDRWRNTPYLCTALNVFAETAVRCGDFEPAVAAIREAIDLAVTRTDDFAPAPAQHLPQLRRTLFTALCGRLAATYDRKNPAAATASVTEICRTARALPADTLTPGDRKMLAGALAMHGTAYAEAGHPEDAVPQFTEALDVLRGSAAGDPGEPDPLMLDIGRSLLSACESLKWHAAAARTAADVLADCQRVQPLWEKQRYDCALAVSDVIANLLQPDHIAEALRLATALSRTCREWLPRGDLGYVMEAITLLQLGRVLADATRKGTALDDWAAAAREGAAGAAFLSERPALVTPEHAHVVGRCATVLASAGHSDEALELSTRAVELYESLAAHHDDLDPLPRIAGLYQQGALLSAQGRPGDAIGPLEQAVPVLLALGSDIPREQWMLLRGMVDLLRQAYRATDQDDAEQSLTHAIRASGIPLQLLLDQSAGRSGDDLQATLRAAEDEAAADPERVTAALRELLLHPAGAREYLTAWAASEQVVTTLTTGGLFSEALRLCDVMITSGDSNLILQALLDGGVSIRDWAQIEGRSLKLNVQLNAGLDPETVLAEAATLLARADELTGESDTQDGPDFGQARETLLRVSARAALLLHRWPDALRSVQAETASMHARGAPPPAIALEEFNSFSALVGMGQLAEAEDLLNRCEAAFRRDHTEQDSRLGLVTGARAMLAAWTGDPDRAVELQSIALARMYQSQDVTQIQRGHAALGSWHSQADPYSPLALAHILAAAVLAELTGQSPDIPAITRTLFFRASECPQTLGDLCAVMGETLGTRFAALLENLNRSRIVLTPDEAMARLLWQARYSQRELFDKLAEFRMQWDPVFAGMIIAARQGDTVAARAVANALSVYADSADWSQLGRALGHIFHQRPEAAAAVILDDMDAVLLRRCTDAFQGIVQIPPELACAMPVNNVLAEVLFSAQSGKTSSALARVLEGMAGDPEWEPLVGAINKILAGERDPRMASGLDPGSAAITAALLGHLAAEH